MNNYWETFVHAVERFPDRPAIVVQRREANDELLYRTLRHEAESFAALLTGSGIAQGDRCAIIGENSPAWCAAYLGIMRLGAIAVPIDRTWTAVQVEKLLTDSGAKVLFASALCMEQAEAALRLSRQPFRIVHLALTGGDPTIPVTRAPAGVARDDPAIILYTSGTTSEPKGVVLTHGNILSAVDGMLSALPLDHNDCSLGALPLFHILSQISGLLLPFAEGGRVVMLEEVSPPEVLRALRERDITALCSVPQFFYLIHERITREIGQLNMVARTAVRMLIVASGVSRDYLGFNLGAVAFRKIHAIVGPKMRFFVSAGAAFDPSIERDLHRLGFDIVHAYGLTESTGAATMSRLRSGRLGTVGVPVKGVAVSVVGPSGEACAAGAEGEIVLRGPTIMAGYYRRADATAAAFRDGWFLTGDLGFFGADGELRISGRSKEMIVLDSGKNVFPDEIERHLERSAVIKEVCVVGRRPPGRGSSELLFAAVVPDMTELRARRVTNLRDYVRHEIDTLCAQLPPHKRIAGLRLLREDLPRTTTRKIKRHVVLQLLDQSDAEQPPQESADRQWSAEDRVWADSPLVAKILQVIHASSPAGPAAVHPDDSLELDLQFDSLGRIELIVALEQAVGVKLRPGEADGCYTVRDLVTVLLRAVPAANATDARPGGAVAGWPKLLDEALTGEAGVMSPRPAGPVIDALRYSILKILWVAARLLFRLKVRGLENLPEQGAFLLCASHQSYLDGVLLFSALPYRLVRRTVSLGKTNIFAHPVMRWFADRLNIAVVDADSNLVQAMQISALALHRKRALLLFPEGERSLDGELQPLRRGAAVLSCHMHVPILPVVIDGTHKVWPRGRSIQGLAPVTICILPPVLPPGSIACGSAGGFDEATARVTADLQSRMKTALGAIRSSASGA